MQQSQQPPTAGAAAAGARALESSLVELVNNRGGQGLNCDIQAVALAVDALRLGPDETATAVLPNCTV